LLALVRSVHADARITLLVVPDFHRRAPIVASSGWRDAVDRALERGAELALHGLSHLDDGGRSPTLRAFFARRFLTDGEAEFAALGAAEARARIERGLAMLRDCGWEAAGFVPPAWQISDAARSVLADYGFRYTTTLRTIAVLPADTRFAVPCLGFSALQPPPCRVTALERLAARAAPQRAGAADRAASDRRTLRGDARRLARNSRGRAARSARGHEKRSVRGARAVGATRVIPIVP
jgi:predicted deacetylase